MSCLTTQEASARVQLEVQVKQLQMELQQLTASKEAAEKRAESTEEQLGEGIAVRTCPFT